MVSITYLKTWMKALRLPFLTATIVPVILGATVAWYSTDTFNGANFLYTLIGISFLHFGTNLTNDYFDHKTKNDELNSSPTPFSGGSRVIQDGLLPPRTIFIAALVFLCIGSIFGIYICWILHSYVILIMGIIGVLCCFFYTAYPIMLGYRGGGELIVGLCFGPLVVLGSYYVQAMSFSLMPVLASIPVGILIALVLYINEFPDYDADKLVHKQTIIVILGKEKAIKLFHALLGLVYVYILVFIALNIFPLFTLIILLTLPLALKAYFISRKNFQKIYELIPANALTISLHLTIGLLLSVSFVFDKIF